MRRARRPASRSPTSWAVLGLRVVNTAVPPNTLVKASPGAGHGITGMRERVSMLNGEMTAGPTDDGGYEVAVFLPVTVQTEGEA